jgi:hypothetical protein
MWDTVLVKKRVEDSIDMLKGIREQDPVCTTFPHSNTAWILLHSSCMDGRIDFGEEYGLSLSFCELDIDSTA